MNWSSVIVVAVEIATRRGGMRGAPGGVDGAPGGVGAEATTPGIEGFV